MFLCCNPNGYRVNRHELEKQELLQRSKGRNTREPGPILVPRVNEACRLLESTPGNDRASTITCICAFIAFNSTFSKSDPYFDQNTSSWSFVACK